MIYIYITKYKINSFDLFIGVSRPSKFSKNSVDLRKKIRMITEIMKKVNKA